RSYGHGGLASTGKAVDLKSTGPRGPWGFESLALRHSFRKLQRAVLERRFSLNRATYPILLIHPEKIERSNYDRECSRAEGAAPIGVPEGNADRAQGTQDCELGRRSHDSLDWPRDNIRICALAGSSSCQRDDRIAKTVVVLMEPIILNPKS